MSVWGDWKAATIGNGETTSAEVDLGRDFEYVNIYLPTVTSCTIGLQVAEKSGGTFATLGIGTNVTGTTTGDCYTTLELGGYRFIKVVSSASQGASRAITVRGYRG